MFISIKFNYYPFSTWIDFWPRYPVIQQTDRPLIEVLLQYHQNNISIFMPNKCNTFLCFWQIWMLSDTPWELSDETHNKYTIGSTHAYNSDIRDNTETLTQTPMCVHTHTHTHTHRHTHKNSLSWGCVISQSSLSAVLWSPQRALMITLSLLLSSAFSQKMRTHTFCLFICTSLTPRLSGSLGINFFQMFSCFPHPKMKEKRSTMLGNEKEKKDERRKHKREVVGGEGGR